MKTKFIKIIHKLLGITIVGMVIAILLNLFGLWSVSAPYL